MLRQTCPLCKTITHVDAEPWNCENPGCPPSLNAAPQASTLVKVINADKVSFLPEASAASSSAMPAVASIRYLTRKQIFEQIDPVLSKFMHRDFINKLQEKGIQLVTHELNTILGGIPVENKKSAESKLWKVLCGLNNGDKVTLLNWKTYKKPVLVKAAKAEVDREVDQRIRQTLQAMVNNKKYAYSSDGSGGMLCVAMDLNTQKLYKGVAGDKFSRDPGKLVNALIRERPRSCAEVSVVNQALSDGALAKNIVLAAARPTWRIGRREPDPVYKGRLEAPCIESCNGWTRRVGIQNLKYL